MTRLIKNKRFLFVVFFDPNGLTTIKDNISFYKKFSQHHVEVLNLFNICKGQLMLPSYINLKQYNGIIIHPTICYFPHNLASLDAQLDLKLKNYQGVKILMKQDEHVRSFETSRLINEKRFDLVLTCLPESERHIAYPKEIVGDVLFFQTLTGYISPFLRELAPQNFVQSSAKIGYRGSIQPLSCGRLGFEKRKIGYDVTKECQSRSIACDISSKWEDRIHGYDWFTYLKSLKAVLGCESGSNIFDFEGDVEIKCTHFLKQHKNIPPESEEIYLKAHEEFLHLYEGNVLYNQISPRHFEAAATMTPQILYEGDYSHIFEPWKHYLPLKKDMSNFNDIIDCLNDSSKTKQMVEQAYNDIVLNKKYHIEHFAEEFDQKINDLIANKKEAVAEKNRVNKTRKKVLILVPHELHIDPRITWFKNSFGKDYEICLLGIHDDINGPVIELNQKEGVTSLSVHIDLDESIHFSPQEISRIDRPILFWVDYLKKVSLASLKKNKDTPRKVMSRLKWNCEHFLQINQILHNIGDKIQNFDLVVACDLNSLLAGVLLSQKHKVPLVYDAHEYWPFADMNMEVWEEGFFQAMERDLLPYVDLPITVTPFLANLMSKNYKTHFETLPNAESLSISENVLPAFKRKSSHKKCRFLFQGNYAPGRGIDKLIKLWPKTNENAELHLRGPQNLHFQTFYDLAEKSGLLNTRIFFCPSLPETELVKGAADFDVGLIPYDPEASVNYQFCCPNKLSQFMAAGIPILANNLDFVKGQIEAAECGFAVNFNNEEKCIALIEKLTQSQELRLKMGEAGHLYFHKHFHWEILSAPLFQKINELLSSCSLTEKDFNLTFLSKLKKKSGSRYRKLKNYSIFPSLKFILDGILFALPKEKKIQLKEKLKKMIGF
jgi:glycosyltransferase involved in cell wall biosynthesis